MGKKKRRDKDDEIRTNRGMIPRDPAKSKSFDSFGVLGLFVAILTLILTPQLWLKVVLLLVSFVLWWVFIFKSEWTLAWTKSKRIFF